MSALRLHWRPGPAAMAPHAALAEIGADYELVLVERDAQGRSTEAYLRLNPAGLIPTLEDGDLVLTESAAILLYLADGYPEARLAPADRAEYYRWLVFMTNTLQTTFLRLIYPERYGGEDVGRIATEEAHRLFDLVDRSLDGREWLAGDHRTGADLFLFMLARWGRRLEPAAWDRPNLRAHWRRTLGLPGVGTMMVEQGLEPPDWAVRPG